MADNTRLNPGTGGDLIATDDIGAPINAKVQLIKVGFGANDEWNYAASGTPLPVTVISSAALTVSVDDAPVQDSAIAGTAAVANVGRASSAAPANVADGDAQWPWLTQAGATVINDGGGSITVDGTVSVTGTTTVSGTVAVSSLPALAAGTAAIGTVEVTEIAAGTNLIGSVTISEGGNDATVTAGGALTVTSLAAGAGPATHDSAAPATGFPVTGFASATAPTAVQANDAARVWTDLNGRVQVGDGGGSLSVDDSGGSLTVDDGGTSLTVDGTVAVSSLPALPTGSNTIGVVTVAAGTAYIGKVRITDGTNDATVTVGGSANVNVTNTVAVSDGGGSITVDGAVTVSGTATISGSIASITTSVTPGTSSSNLGKAIDAVAGSTDVGVASLATVVSSLTAITPVAGDYANMQVDGNGSLWVRSSGVVVVQGERGLDIAVPSAAECLLVCGVASDVPGFGPSPVDADGDAQAISLTRSGYVRTVDTPVATDGAECESFISAAAVLSEVIKAQPGTLYGIVATNTSTSARYVRIYDKATAATTSDTPIFRVAIPGNTSGAGFAVNPKFGLKCDNGIAIRVTAGAADNSNAALAASEVLANFIYA